MRLKCGWKNLLNSEFSVVSKTEDPTVKSTNRNRRHTIQSRYILMPVSMLVRCEKCGYENFPQHRFCGMCAAELRLPGPGGSPPVPSPAGVASSPIPSRPAPPPKEKREEVVVQKVSGPSFLGLGNEPSDSSGSVSYLLEEDEPPDHRGRNVILIVLIVAAAAAAWHWGQELRIVAGRLFWSPPPGRTAGNN